MSIYRMMAEQAERKAAEFRRYDDESQEYADDYAAIDRGSNDPGSSDRVMLLCAKCGAVVISIRELSTDRYVAVCHADRPRQHVTLGKNTAEGIEWREDDPRTRVLVRCPDESCPETFAPRLFRLRDSLLAAGSDGLVVEHLFPQSGMVLEVDSE